MILYFKMTPANIYDVSLVWSPIVTQPAAQQLVEERSYANLLTKYWNVQEFPHHFFSKLLFFQDPCKLKPLVHLRLDICLLNLIKYKKVQNYLTLVGKLC